MEKYKRLFNNSILFSIGELGSKLITFIMLPLYTYALTTSEFGTMDLMVTTTSLLLPVVGLSIFDSVLRFTMDKDRNPVVIFSNSMYVTILSSLILCVIIPVLAFINLKFIFIPVLLVVQLFQSLFGQYAKAINRTKLFALNGILLSFVTAGLNIIFLIPLKMGLNGYMISLILSNLISSFFLARQLKVLSIYKLKRVDKKEIVEQLRYSLPLIPNSIAWWLTNTIGRYFILIFLGTAANGIFAVSSKIPALISVFTAIFSQSWQISAFEEYEKNKGNSMVGTVYNFYFFLLLLGGSSLILMIRPIINLLVSTEFFESWQYVPFLVLSAIFSSASGFVGIQYTAMKKTGDIFKTTIIGSVINISLNFIFVPIMGIQAVGISSFISFFFVWLIRNYRINKVFDMQLDNKKFIIALVLMIIQAISSTLNLSIISIVIQIMCLTLIIITYRTYLNRIIVSFRKIVYLRKKSI